MAYGLWPMAGTGAQKPYAAGHKPYGSHLRQRSTAAVVLSRDDAPAPGAYSPPTDADAGGTRAARRPRWPTVVTWILLGGAIAALWAVLLFGDSLRSSA